MTATEPSAVTRPYLHAGDGRGTTANEAVGNTFYEDDEPVEKIEKAFGDGEHGITAPPEKGSASS